MRLIYVAAPTVWRSPGHSRSLSMSIRFLHAQWGVGTYGVPAYPDDLVERYEPYTVEMRSLSGLDHAGTIMTHSGAAAVAEVIKEALRAGSQS